MTAKLLTANNSNVTLLFETLISLYGSVNISTLVVSFSLIEDTLRCLKIRVKCNLLWL